MFNVNIYYHMYYLYNYTLLPAIHNCPRLLQVERELLVVI